MIYFEWSNENDEILKSERGISFGHISDIINSGGMLSIIKHPDQIKRAHQVILAVKIDNYMYAVPCVITGDKWFLKTAYPNKKLNKIFLKKGDLL